LLIRNLKNNYKENAEKLTINVYLIIINHDNKCANKKFWSYKKNEGSGIPALEKNHQLVMDNLDKANILNDQFSSVYTIDNDCIEHLPSLKVPSVPNIQLLHIEAKEFILYYLN